MRFIFILFFCISFSLFAEYNFTFKKITTNHGLSNNAVNTIIQDKEGYIWLGTLNGLNKFDGYHFKKYRYDRHDPHSLSGNRVYSLLYNDSKNDLWIGLFDGGLNRLSFLDHSIKNYEIDKNNLIKTDKHIRHIFKDSTGNIWISTNGNGLKKIHHQGEKVTTYQHDIQNPSSIDSNKIRMVFEDSQDHIWIATKGDGFVSQYNPKHDSFKRYDFKLNGKNIEWITEDNQGKLYFGSRDGALNIVNPKTHETKHVLFRYHQNYPMKNSLIRHLFFEKESDLLWIGTEKGLYIYDTIKETHSPVKNLEDIHVRTIFKDKMGLIWIGTLSNGAIKVNKNTIPMTYLLHDKNNSHSLVDDSVWNLYEDDEENLWVSTRHGVTLFDKNNHFITKYTHDESNPHSMSESNTTSIIKYAPNTYWLGTYGSGIEILKRKEGQFFNINKNSTSFKGLTSNYISKLLQDSQDNIWISTYDGGLHLFNKEKQSFQSFNQKTKKNSLLNSYTRDIIQDGEKNIWVATYGEGLFLYENQEFKRYAKTFNKTLNPIDNSVFSLAYDKKNNYIWGASEGGYLIFDLNQKKFIEFDFLKPLNQKGLIGVIVDHQNNIWFSSGKGIAWVKFKEKKVLLFDTKDGLLTDEFNENAYLVRKNGDICFGSQKGAILIDSKKIKINQKKPTINLLSIKINGQFHKTKTASSDIVLNNGNHMILLQFSVTDYLDNMQNSYKYKIPEINDTWSDFRKSNELVLTTLKPGHYTIYVKGKNSKGIESENTIKISIRIKPPFYSKLEFIILSIVFLCILIFSIIKYRTSSIEKANMILAEKVNEKTKELHETNKKLREMALSDSLTGLRNRYFFRIVVKDEIQDFIKNKQSLVKESKKNNESPQDNNNIIGLFLVDLDHFKNVNDHYGHDSGDLVLKQLADVFRSTLRGSDTIIRWGGEEFLIILKNSKSDYLDVYCKKLLAAVNQYPFKVLNGESIIHKSCSIGYVKYPLYPDDPDYLSLEHAIVIADLALYHAKKTGRNRGIKLGITEHKPAIEDVPEYLESLDHSIQHQFLNIEEIIKGDEHD